MSPSPVRFGLLFALLVLGLAACSGSGNGALIPPTAQGSQLTDSFRAVGMSTARQPADSFRAVGMGTARKPSDSFRAVGM